MSYKIETHDYDVRLKNAKKFVSQGHRVGGRSATASCVGVPHEDRARFVLRFFSRALFFFFFLFLTRACVLQRKKAICACLDAILQTVLFVTALAGAVFAATTCCTVLCYWGFLSFFLSGTRCGAVPRARAGAHGPGDCPLGKGLEGSRGQGIVVCVGREAVTRIHARPRRLFRVRRFFTWALIICVALVFFSWTLSVAPE